LKPGMDTLFQQQIPSSNTSYLGSLNYATLIAKTVCVLDSTAKQ